MESTQATLIKTEENGKLIKATAIFGRSKSLTVNYYGGYTYLHLTNQSAKAKGISFGLDEYEQLLQLTDIETIRQLNHIFEIQSEQENELADKAAAQAIETPSKTPTGSGSKGGVSKKRKIIIQESDDEN